MTKVRFLSYYVAIVVVLVVLARATITNSAPTDAVEITAHNPYRISVNLEVKCDWNSSARTYKLHRFYTIPGKKSVVIHTPRDVRRCEVWPKIKWL